jgi:hypothetical protein
MSGVTIHWRSVYWHHRVDGDDQFNGNEHDRQSHHLETQERLLQQRCTLVPNPSGSATADVGTSGISIDATTTRCRYRAAHPTAGTMMITLTTEGKITTTIARRTITYEVPVGDL